MFAGRRVHLMGIGGAGMSALVPLLRAVGAQVDGCDLAASRTVEDLRADGVAVALGHDPDHLAGCEVVVHSSAIPHDHAELRAARAAGCMVWSRPACLAELLRGRTTLAVAGSHGKTSTAALLTHILTGSGHDPAAVIGARVADLAGGARLGAATAPVV
ncbi:MAG: Mur ligase domain-containing protein, partial [Planctomycetota bacterium]